MCDFSDFVSDYCMLLPRMLTPEMLIIERVLTGRIKNDPGVSTLGPYILALL